MRIAGFEVGQKLGPAHGCRTYFADDNPSRMIGQLRRLFHCRSARASESESGYDGIPGARHIEYFSGECGQMPRGGPVRRPCEERHPFLASSNQSIVALKLLKQL